jgi:3-oxoacyl-[acyl-carrier-protein] synthase II
MLFPLPNLAEAHPRVVITGAGVITALGRGWQANAEGFRTGRRAFRPVSHFDVSRQRVKTAAEADLPDLLSNLFPATRLTHRQVQRLDRAGQMLLLAALEAWQQSGWQADEPGADNLPLVLGTTAGGMLLGEAYYRQAIGQPAHHRQQAVRAVYYQPQVQARMVFDALGCRGPITVISNACASGANAIGHAWDLLRSGQAERALAGGYDALGELVFSGFDSLQALSPTVCRPFDSKRDGLALGEGAAMLALETLGHARRRRALILGELIGYGTSIDQHHLTQPQPQGRTTLAVMRQACASAAVTPDDIDYVNAHGTGTPLNDGSEAVAISEWAGAHAATLPVSSTKASIGHLLGAAGAVEAVVCLMALRGQWLPPQEIFDTPDPACQFPIVHQPQKADLNLVLSNSFGFGGVNAALIFRRWL